MIVNCLHGRAAVFVTEIRMFVLEYHLTYCKKMVWKKSWKKERNRGRNRLHIIFMHVFKYTALATDAC